MDKQARRGGTWVQRWRVPLGFACAALFLIFAQPYRTTMLVGGAVALLGLLIRAWAAGHIRKNDRLAVTGPYAFTRNPLYLGSFLMGIGFSVAASRWWLGLLFVALFAGIYLPVMRVEARTLREMFSADYEDYARRVPLFVPRLTAYRPPNQESATKTVDTVVRFDKNLYLRYREYRAALGTLSAWCVLWLKAMFLS